ncbi:hypothetical protein [Actinomadura sp. WMMA1423]|uniref:hypothetical protein n=1 Tax=Actinomadura sp. WMMA1423 TaxID=2591108 RepID=UPI0011461978|nr:hypothetical protein [Actinomadura sp. WMMA1423]
MSHGNHMDDDRRPCARGTRCISAAIVRENGRTLHQPALGYRTLCDADRAGLMRTIIALPGLYDVANSMLGDHPAPQHGADARPTGRPTPPSLVNTGMDELMRTIYHVAASWYERVDAAAGGGGFTTAQIGRMNQQTAIRAMAWFLAKHVDALLALGAGEMVRYISLQAADELPDDVMVIRHYAAGYATSYPALGGGDASNEFFDLAARARRRLGLTGSDVDLPVPCTQPDCGERGHMVRPDGVVGLEDYAICRSCGHRYEDTPDDPAFSDLMKDVAAWNIARAKKKRTKETTSP